MPGALLETKMYTPKLRPGSVRRPRLVEAVEAEELPLLTLVSAPPGFGKTTMLVEWLTATTMSRARQVAWLSLDASDGDPQMFWTYVIEAIRRAEPGIGDAAMRALEEVPAPPIIAVLTSLLNELAGRPKVLVLVLDDFHAIESRQILSQMDFFLDNAPAELRVVIATRSDPSFPLAKLRARGDLLEVRAAQLRFTIEEARSYLERALDRPLGIDDINALEARTEGWIAALQLAALSMKGVEEVGSFISGFAGDDRFILDYLVEEVLDHQPAHVRQFLMRTSILDRLSGPLCDALTGHHGSKRILESLDRENLFLVPLDERRHWYRYHHLFADVLHSRLEEEQPELLSELHRRASDWYEGDDQPLEAVRHAVSAGDSDRAASLVERFIPTLRQSRDDATVERWLDALPRGVFRTRPGLSIQYAGAKLARGDLGGVEELLLNAERAVLAEAPRDEPNEEAVGPHPSGSLPSSIALYRSAQARLLDDVAGTLAHAHRALELALEGDAVLQGSASALVGLAHWTNGDLKSARKWYSAGMASLRAAGHLADVVGGAVILADICIVQGRLREAMRLHRSGLALSTEGRKAPLRGTADMHVGIAELYREQNDLESAARHLASSETLGELNGLPKNPFRWHLAAARLQMALGDLDAAEELISRANELYVADFSPEVAPVWAVQSRIALAQGRQEEVLRWAAERSLFVNGSLSYVQESGHIVLARALIARGSEESRHQAVTLLERLLIAAAEGGREGSVVEILVLQAMAAKDSSGALVPLAQALGLAEPEGYGRIFLDEGRPMEALLRAARQRGIAVTYTSKLLAAATTPAPQTRQAPLLDPLSEREQAVLRLLASELSGPDLARQLVVSVNTIRTHTKSIYMKLGVNSRRAAVRRAEELGMMSRPDPGAPSPLP